MRVMRVCGAFFHFTGGFMAQYDGAIRINTKIDSKEASSQLMTLENRIVKTADKIASLRSKMDSLKEAKIPTEEYQEISAQISKAESEFNKLLEKQEQMQREGKDNGVAWDRLNAKMEEVGDTIRYAKGELQDLIDAGKAFTPGTGTEEYTKLGQQLQYAENDLYLLNRRHDELMSKQKKASKGYKKLGDVAKKSFEKANKSVKKSNGFLSTMASRFKGLALSLLIFNQISKAFNSMISGIKEGMQNLAQYSNDTNDALSLLMSRSTYLKNALATAFSPIVEIIAPILARFIELLGEAATKVSELFSALMGKETFTKAVKVQQDYANSLKDTSKNTEEAAEETKKALAPFDDLRQIQFQETKEKSEGAGTELTPDQMFETAKVSDDMKGLADTFKTAIDAMKEKAKELKDVFMSGFWDGLGDYKPRLEELKSDLQKIGGYLKDIFTDADVRSAASRFVNSFVYMIGTFVGSLASIGLTIATNIVGGIESYLSGNVERIKAWIIRMFDVGTEINTIFSNFFIAFADVFSVFASQTAQDITGSVIQIFADVFGGILELTLKFTRDVLNVMLTPFVENKDKIKDALMQTLEPIKVVIQGIASAVRNAVDKIVALYDEHIHPFLESIKDGLSEFLEKLLDAYTDHIVPILDKLGAKFKEVMEGPVGDAINSAINFIGKLVDTVKWLWEEAFVPFIGWIIDNILPVIAPILETLGELILNFSASVTDLISGILDALSGLIDFVVGIFSGDWAKAWNGVKQVFEAVWNLIIKSAETGIENIKSLISGLLNTVKEAAKAIASLFEGKNASQILLGNASKKVKRSMSYQSEIFYPEVASVSLPYKIPALATGTVVPPNREFMAVLGDNKREPEVVSPISTMKQAVVDALSEAGFSGENQSERPIYIDLYIGQQKFAHAVYEANNQERQRVGVRLVTQNG